MKNCIDEEIMQAWFDGELSADEAAKVAAHLRVCVACAESARTVEAENQILSEGLAAEFAAPVLNAIATTRDAARKNPKDPLTNQFVLAAYQSKIDFMTTDPAWDLKLPSQRTGFHCS